MRKAGCILLAALLTACTLTPDWEPGVSQTLAQARAERISGLSYALSFEIPDTLDAPCKGAVTLAFDLKGRGPLLLDFRPGAEAVSGLTVNGEILEAEVRDEHILLPARALRRGTNEVTVRFTPDDAPLNRHDGFLYSLLVPERARTLFPCFDQPDLKARFSLELDIPAGWTAVSNGPVAEERTEGTRKQVRFSPSGLVSTYLFAFVAGKWERADFDRNGSPIAIYHRETDPAKRAQLPEIHRQIVHALDWMEDFTGIPMPFRKYDCVLVPGFQFGGMEHPGVILYNASRTFLSEAPTDTERLYRTELISHETAHLWFGDAVTMRWFDDVWTKEVFANYFAARITEPLFPETDFRLRNFQYFNIPAYAEDRTAGTHPIRQRLDNLKDAGLVYGNIVYDKAPVVMRMLADTLGTEAFQAGMREYLETYLYRNATWPELIDILDRHTAADLKAWSHRWVEEAGMPHYTAGTELPNLSALGYGYYEMSEGLMKKALHAVLELDNPHERLSTLANLYENMLHGNVPAERMTECLDTLLSTEKEPLIASAALGYLDDLWHRQPARTETLLHDLARTPSVPGQIRLSAFRKLVHFHADAGTDGELFSMWRDQAPYPGLVITAEDYTTMAFELAIRRPQDLETLRNVQRARIDNPDRQARFDFVFPSVHPDQAVRDSVFQALLQAENRHTEPWAEDCLRFLNHPLRQVEALSYIVPALDILPEIQRTGDIFFPKNWVVCLLSGHDSPEAANQVKSWLAAHPDCPPLLRNKVLQAADRLLR